MQMCLLERYHLCLMYLPLNDDWQFPQTQGTVKPFLIFVKKLTVYEQRSHWLLQWIFLPCVHPVQCESIRLFHNYLMSGTNLLDPAKTVWPNNVHKVYPKWQWNLYPPKFWNKDINYYSQLHHNLQSALSVSCISGNSLQLNFNAQFPSALYLVVEVLYMKALEKSHTSQSINLYNFIISFSKNVVTNHFAIHKQCSCVGETE